MIDGIGDFLVYVSVFTQRNDGYWVTYLEEEEISEIIDVAMLEFGEGRYVPESPFFNVNYWVEQTEDGDGWLVVDPHSIQGGLVAGEKVALILNEMGEPEESKEAAIRLLKGHA